ncbi:TetR family transcriptional regulator [Kozakia baliensis]|uniref:TetR family transcriptional regulator n=1 Tax=Kozakia baliensis TaxID=153496 RepID=A0A1D8UVX7_9PROT|nr:TetR family transcriptional regulator [Kozakia baliensis]AOX17808.1 TetR family transcriptional regulator [Kozakia baliensis]GBR33655.1 TetR family transcriptional regulator [Kozakia baliensis NRIC 0488]GEL64888.1 hypothetical protein KBA01_21740 [Kozakia baliensis]
MIDTDQEAFDAALLHAVMRRAAESGWRRVSLVDAARTAELPVDEVRARFPFKHMVLIRLGRIADESALRDDGSAGTLRERLFDLLMRRFDVFQQYREGIKSVLHALPYDPPLALLLGAATSDTMDWISRVAGVDIDGLAGKLRLQGVIGIWAYALKAWEKDESRDLSSTMAALDQALDRAERLGVLKATAEHRMRQAEENTDIADHPLELES